MHAQVLEVFPTPILRATWPDSDALHAELKRVILARREASPGSVVTNRGGWHSENDLQTWPEPSIRQFMQRLQMATTALVQHLVPHPEADQLQGWRIEAWANVNPPGAYNRAHHHLGGGNLWSGVYYVDTGETDAGAAASAGETVFLDGSGLPIERVSRRPVGPRELRVRPCPGVMLVFPAGLLHAVEPHRGASARVTIAFNLRHPAFVIPVRDDAEPTGWWWRNFRGVMVAGRRAAAVAPTLAALPGALTARRWPRSGGWAAWSAHLRTAVARATVEGRERVERRAHVRPSEPTPARTR
jgi:uncharacterized protein (TIGR02466 family)